MPTGYTAAIKDGISFEEFAMRCARNFGECIMMRDEPSGTPIPEKFEPSPYHVSKLKDLYIELKRLESTCGEVAEGNSLTDFTAEMDRYNDLIEEKNSLREKYNDMLLRAKSWEPPSPNHNGMKAFMIDQIKQSIDFDLYEPDHPVKLTGDSWLQRRLEKTKKDIQYHTKKNIEEIARIKDRNKWIELLRESLNKQ